MNVKKIVVETTKKKLNQTSAPSAQIYSQKLCNYQINERLASQIHFLTNIYFAYLVTKRVNKSYKKVRTSIIFLSLCFDWPQKCYFPL